MILKPKREVFIYYSITSKYSIRKLLPIPFKTDCYDYGSLSSEFESREYCYLNVMRKLELKYCNVNQFWRINVEMETWLKNNVTKCISPNYIYLNIMCKVDCLDVKSNNEIIKNKFKIDQLRSGNPDKLYQILIQYNDQVKNILYFEYLPKFTKIELFSTLGGLIGMWLGLSINNLVQYFLKIVNKLISKLYKLGNVTKKVIIYSNFILFLIMTLHLRTLMINFLSGQTITKIKIINKIDIPDIMISAAFLNIEPACNNIVNTIINNHANIESLILRRFSQMKKLRQRKSNINV